ncbi:MAG: right-handed parallel beta-helix repeat-containing protein, partial [Planctomycetaceae bacterium]
MNRLIAARLPLSTVLIVALAGVGLWASSPAGRQPAAIGDAGDVRDFGAVGDGTADDTAAIQRAVDSGIGSIRFPKGAYRLTKTVVIDLDRVGFTSLVGDGTASIVMAGPGPAFKFVGTHEGSAAPKTFQDNVWKNQRTPTVDGLEIVGAHPEAVGVEATGTMQFTATRLVVRKALHAVHLTNRNRNVILSNCHLYENRGIGVYYDDVDLHQSNIVGCHISYNGGGGVVSRAGNVRNIHIGTCDIESNHSPDGEPTANVLIDCAGGVAGTAEVAIVGCTIQHNHTSPNSANIRILGLSGEKDGVPVREGNVTIADNVFSDVQTNVHLRDCKGVTIVGNTFWMGFEHDLLVEQCSDVVVGPNNLGHNARYSYGDSASARDAVVFRDCTDCTLTGLHINGVKDAPAGLLIERGRRFNITGCTILDCDGVGLWLKDVSDSRVSDCLIRDDRPDRKDAVSLRWSNGTGNLIADNLLGGR